MSTALARRVQNGAFAALVRLIRCLPGPRSVRVAGRIMGALSWPFARGWHRRIRGNLDLVYGERLEPARRRAIVRGVFEHSGRGFVELFWHAPEHGLRVSDWCTVEGREHLDAALARGKGVLLATAHIGSWSMIPRELGERGYTVASLLRYPNNQAAANAMRAVLPRARLTAYGTPLSRAELHACLRLLRANGCLFIAADRRAHDVKLPFLGQPAWCATGTASLHLRTGAAVVPVYTLRAGTGHRIVFEPMVEIAYSGERETDSARLTQALHDTFGRWITEHPEQWMWNHRRWRPRRSERKAGAT